MFAELDAFVLEELDEAVALAFDSVVVDAVVFDLDAFDFFVEAQPEKATAIAVAAKIEIKVLFIIVALK